MFITEQKLLKYAICSNALYVFFLFLFRPNGLNLEKLAITSFLLFSVVTILYVGYRNRGLLNELSRSSRTLFYLLFFWSLITILRGFTLNLQDWVTNFGNVYMGLAWLVPVVLILGIKLENWNPVFKSVQFMFGLMLFSILFLFQYNAMAGKLKTEWTWLLRPINFLLLIGVYRFNITRRITIYFSFILYIVVAVFTEQRIEFIFLTLVFFFLLITKLKHVKIKKTVFKYIIIGFTILMVLVFTYGYENISLLINKIIEFKDSRTFLFTELLTDLNTVEKIFGKGSLGTYYSPFFSKVLRYFEHIGEYWFALDNPTRITVEVGYLQMILKGGFLLLLLNFGLMLSSVYLAVFKSNNNFVKRLGLFILSLTLLSLISFRPAFTPTFILLWMSIGTVLSKKNRMMTNEEIESKLKIK
ncbi:hypothetical protein [Psychroserpens jangbogonensis]|uniref:hypothetical protein n=1 Tax=Psychroserpens jangbogonensis TaxID=1484460 RepID=UPI00053CF805|nr:hypothetical protein [Psychroserpens jangbogonensis]